MFLMGARLDETLRRWEAQTHWPQTKPRATLRLK
jgi:hypothetical protein